MEVKPYQEIKNMIEYGGRKHQLEALTYGYQDITDKMSQSNDPEVSKFAEFLDGRPDLQVERQRLIHEQEQKQAKSQSSLKWVFLGIGILMYTLTIILFFLPYLLHAQTGLYYFIGAFVTLLITGLCVGGYFMIARPKARLAKDQIKKSEDKLNYARAFQSEMITRIHNGDYDK